ncbi:transmembrane protein 68-like isoform X1 [Photinus pyralis]|uniref:Phospholipid/glycerol acyltransferase domain-containing protein n=1 Tax=Photinus pyralis TaxID=7054 RepID=A0A1Y1L121_PHOPY|nr:transmembrane protein 68-like isoform X1 [Photinus pyralis]XP_031327956.1 transmembrane protein 68-like isoform X1 [Photinus pyralis]XP_031327957.1 transmembrane protein 68-like isoform X1 [Photinus pyralis]XP_031327958.1 transmembrane protein 68-like isoform X1 [Photinus pyralis]XP_031327959.1 transmembrane protein 68-like isoform X1 [Photinus pyralis]
MGYVNCQCLIMFMCLPIFVVSLLPFMIAVLVYQSVLILTGYVIYCKILQNPYDLHTTSNVASRAHRFTWYLHGWIWNGYEVQGLENIPDSGPALIIFYHGALPVDIYYLIAHLFFHKDRVLQAVADYFLFKVPGLKILLESIGVIPGSQETCTKTLKDGNLLAISPGGVYESQFSHRYNLLWKNRVGFAKVAIDAKVPIIPVFTENLREAYRTLSTGKSLFEKIYNATKFPFTPIYGGFPVKLITHIGKPIPYDPELSPEQLKTKVANAIEELIAKHQRRPPSILRAVMDRIPAFRVEHKDHIVSKES